jgi:hypothetical protein
MFLLLWSMDLKLFSAIAVKVCEYIRYLYLPCHRLAIICGQCWSTDCALICAALLCLMTWVLLVCVCVDEGGVKGS